MEKNKVFWSNHNNNDRLCWILEVFTLPDRICHKFWMRSSSVPYFIAYLNRSKATSFNEINGDHNEYKEALTWIAVAIQLHLYSNAVIPWLETIVLTTGGMQSVCKRCLLVQRNRNLWN